MPSETPTPWYSEPCFSELANGKPCWCACISTKLGSNDMEDCVVPYGSVGREDAALIVRAVNSHAAAQKLAEAAERVCDPNCISTKQLDKRFSQLADALSAYRAASQQEEGWCE